MLEITIPATELWDEVNNEFLTIKEQTLQLEHSLVSLSKWESKWCKPFFSTETKTSEEIIDYVKCMTTTKTSDEVYNYLTDENIVQINNYIGAPMTATKITERKGGPRSGETITSEILYYQMIALGIPFECQNWHINRLLTLIKVCNIKSSPPKKMGRQEQLSQNAALNAARRQKLNTKG